ncbi:epoxide hydrolase [Pseudohongiella sp. SYSU M77423]|uniref:epoxide hydrolase family protein n=1 Tax=Pseudohongiella sp. SYSU M77423 TaxID=3042312 RepID=UPI00247FCA78|nr:epoxide hydrolase family protein [Pseudohongiella sp. SYSU M77423]MDH7942841.1 epoxide hydrolase [Pseudohongiella sp. SYSU M77423]
MRFEIHVPDQAIADLRYRLANARLPAQIPGTGWEYGTNAQYLTELVDYWQHQFDWREQERQLNTLDQYVTTIDGVPIHFIHQRSSNPDATPLMITHGWPGSIAEFRHIIGPLTEPQQHGGNAEDAFHVIAPSLPGFGFSGEPQERGFNPERMAQILAALMQRLGYDQYGLQGGDWGAIINRIHADQFADRVLGLHSNFVLASPPEDPAIRDDVTEEEMTARRERQAFMADEVGYQQIQGTKPQTLGVALNDSPAGLAAWIVEKFHGWSDIDRQSVNGLDTKFSKDDLLTDISIYWFSASITSSARIYYENRNFPAAEPLGYVEVPTAGAIFPKEIYLTPRRWAEEQYNIVRWKLMPRGGHFAAMEEPELLLDDVRAFFRSL